MVDVKRRSDETEDEYIYRICSVKDDIGSWNEVSDILNDALGYDYDESRYRKMYQSFMRMLAANGRRIVSDASVQDELESAKIDLQKERQKLNDVRSSYMEIVRGQSRDEYLKNIIFEAVDMLQPRPICPIDMPDSANFTKDLLVSLCDIHYGMNVKNYWGEYNSSVCEKYMKNYLTKIADIAVRSGAENCYVWMNGDIISGNTHVSIRVSNREDVIQQIIGVSELISWFIDELSFYFRNVYVQSVAGNHSRLNHKDESIMTERLDRLIPWYLEARCSGNERVHILSECNIDPSMYLVEIRGKKYLGVHGDYDGDSLLKTASMIDGGVDTILTGHLHKNKYDSCNGVTVVEGGSFVGTDEYACSKRLKSEPEQVVCVCDDTGVTCSHWIRLADPTIRS